MPSHISERTAEAKAPMLLAHFTMLMLPVSSPSTVAIGATMGEFPAVMCTTTPTGLQAS